MSLIIIRKAPPPSLIHDMLALIHRHPRAAIVTGVLGLAVPWALDNYRQYLALGPGGLPYNIWGWMVSTACKPFGRDTVSVKEYEKDGNKESWLAFDSIPERRGVRPSTGWHFLPHRQITRLPTAEICEQLDAVFQKHATLNSALVELVKSPHEGHVQGMTIHPSITPHPVAERCWLEIGHVHPPDHSLHLVLSPADCKFVIENGWGERHPLSGVKKVPMSKEYLLIYAPRDQEELEVVEKIIMASIGYMTGSREVL